MFLPHAPRPATWLHLTFAAALLTAAGCGKKEEEETLPPGSTGNSETVRGPASILLQGKFDPPEGAVLEIEQTLVMEKGDVLQTSGENETTGSISMRGSERQKITILEDGTRRIEVGEGGFELEVAGGD